MELHQERKDSILVLVVKGEVDGRGGPELLEALQEALLAGDTGVVLDFGEVVYVTTAGLQSVMVMARDLRSHGTGFALCSLIPPVRDVFEISGFDHIIDIHQGRKAAMRALGRERK